MTTALDAPPSLVAAADLILLRMALPGSTPKKIREAVGKLLEVDLSAEQFDRQRDELASAGLLTAGKRRTLSLTDAGRRRACGSSGSASFRPAPTWAAVSKGLFATAAGLTPEGAAKLKSGDHLAAFVLKRKYGLPAGAGTTVKQVLEAVVCRLLDHPAETTLDGLMRAVLNERIGAAERLTMKDLARQFPLFETGLSSTRADEVRQKLVRDWLAGAPRPDAPAAHAAEPFDLPAFAHTVAALSRTSPPQDRFHDNKVFIAAVWRASRREPNFPRLDLPEFKGGCSRPTRRDLLSLSRADLVQAMDPHLVAESETAYLNATFHFVLLSKDQP